MILFNEGKLSQIFKNHFLLFVFKHTFSFSLTIALNSIFWFQITCEVIDPLV